MMAVYDRRGAAQVLAYLAHPRLLDVPSVVAELPDRIRIAVTRSPLSDQLSPGQEEYRARWLPECPAAMLTPAVRRLDWTDSSGVRATGACRPDRRRRPVPGGRA